jgi:Ser/Thr protein kinase RdoA (MazF antagonist)
MTVPRDAVPPGIRLIRPLARPLQDREVWQSETTDGTPVAVKLVNNPWTVERLPWLSSTIDSLRDSGYRVPRVLWHAALREGWFGIVLEWVPGRPASQLSAALLERLLELIPVHAAMDTGSGGWDVAKWIDNVVFDEWQGWWESATTAAPALAHRLRAFAEPARGSRLSCNDLVHHDFNLSNILVHNGAVSGIVDWQDAGRGSRALDLATLLFEWHRLQEIGSEVAQGGNVRLVEQILKSAGETGLRLVVTYGAIARLALDQPPRPNPRIRRLAAGHPRPAR